MPVVEAKCTNCGAALSVDDSKEAMVCQFCGEAFIVEKAINNYNITNNIQAQTVFINSVSDFEIEGGILKNYRGLSAFVTIPEIVSKIGFKAFWQMNIRSVIIPDGVEIIESLAFGECKRLSNIELPNSLHEIWTASFIHCDSLKEIVLPSGLKSIGANAFRFSGLQSISFDENITNIHIGGDIFSECSNLSNISIPDSVLRNCKYIHKTAFKSLSYNEKTREYLKQKGLLNTTWENGRPVHD